MTIYEHRATVTTAGGSVSSNTLTIQGGLLKNILIRANTSTTVFRVDLTDENGVVRLNWGYHQGELNDQTIEFPMVGVYTVDITNASQTDTFKEVLSVQEN